MVLDYMGWIIGSRPTGKHCSHIAFDVDVDHLGAQMAALSVVGTVQNNQALMPLSLRTGATSKSDPNAGSQAPTDPTANRTPITTADRAGAGILTVLMLAVVVGGAVWLVI